MPDRTLNLDDRDRLDRGGTIYDDIRLVWVDPPVTQPAPIIPTPAQVQQALPGMPTVAPTQQQPGGFLSGSINLFGVEIPTILLLGGLALFLFSGMGGKR